MTTELNYHHIDAHTQYVLGEGAELGLFTHFEYNLAHYSNEVCQRIIDEERAQALIAQPGYDGLARARQIINGWVDTQTTELKTKLLQNNRFVFSTFLALYESILHQSKILFLTNQLDELETYFQTKEQYKTLEQLRYELGFIPDLSKVIEESKTFFLIPTNRYYFNTDIRYWQAEDTEDETQVKEIMIGSPGDAGLVEYNGYQIDLNNFQNCHYVVTNGEVITLSKVLKAKRTKQKKDRAVIKRAYKMATSFGHNKHVNMLINRDKVFIGEDNSDLVFEFCVKRPTFNAFTEVGHGLLHIRLLNKEKEHLSSMCVYIKDTPNIDQFVAFSSLIENGCEDIILEKANFFNISELGRQHPKIRKYGQADRWNAMDNVRHVLQDHIRRDLNKRSFSKVERRIIKNHVHAYLKKQLSLSDEQFKILLQRTPWRKRISMDCYPDPYKNQTIGSARLRKALYEYHNPTRIDWDGEGIELANFYDRSRYTDPVIGAVTTNTF